MKDVQLQMQRENPWRFIDKSEQTQLDSGDCDWPFSLDLINIENFIQIFKHIHTKYDIDRLKDTYYDVLPNYNGLTNPIYITKEPMISEEKKKKKVRRNK